MRRVAVAVFLVVMASGAYAQIGAGTWVMRETPQLSMVVVPAGSGYRITYRFVSHDGKLTGQTYAGKRVDSRHTAGVIKMTESCLGRRSPNCRPTARRSRSRTTPPPRRAAPRPASGSSIGISVRYACSKAVRRNVELRAPIGRRIHRAWRA